MAEKRQLKLGAFMRPVSIHTAAWRYPGGTPDANFNLKALIQYAQTLERGRFDAFFMADHLAVLNMPMEALKRSATVTSFDPLTLLPALAQHTLMTRVLKGDALNWSQAAVPVAVCAALTLLGVWWVARQLRSAAVR